MNYNTMGTWGGDCPSRIEIEYYTDCDILNTLVDNVKYSEFNPFEVFPNPTSDKVQIVSKRGGIIDAIEKIKIYSIAGELLKSIDINYSEREGVELDISFIDQNQLVIISIITAKNKYNEIISINK